MPRLVHHVIREFRTASDRVGVGERKVSICNSAHYSQGRGERKVVYNHTHVRTYPTMVVSLAHNKPQGQRLSIFFILRTHTSMHTHMYPLQ